MATTKQLALPVHGMTCASCVSHVERALKKVAGVSNVGVNLATERATVEYDPTQTRPARPTWPLRSTKRVTLPWWRKSPSRWAG